MSAEVRLRALVLALSLVLGAITFAGPWPTDPTGARAVAPVGSRSLVRASGPLRFAFARREISPRAGEPLAGYGARFSRGSGVARGSAHALWARALALGRGERTVVIVGLDLLCATRALRDDAMKIVRARAPSLEEGSVVFTATHTHSGAGGYSPEFVARFFLGPHDAALRGRLATAIAEAIEAAARPVIEGRGRRAELGSARADEPSFIRNRLIDGGPVDPELFAIDVRALEPGPPPSRVTFISYSAHATVIGADGDLGDGDWPGALARAISGEPDAPGDATVRDDEPLVAAGAVGSCGPRAPEGPDGPARARAMGRALAERVRSLRETVVPSPSPELDAFAVEVEMPKVQPRLSGSLRVAPPLARTQLGTRALFSFARIGGDVLAVAPGDLSCELALRLRARAPRLRGLSFSGDYHGYLLPRERWDLDAYEPRMMWHGPSGGDAVLDALARGADEIARPW